MPDIEFNDRPDGVWAEENLPRTVRAHIDIELSYSRGMSKGAMYMRMPGATINATNPDGTEGEKIGVIDITMGAGLTIQVERIDATYHMGARAVWEAVVKALADIPDRPEEE